MASAIGERLLASLHNAVLCQARLALQWGSAVSQVWSREILHSPLEILHSPLALQLW